jgi:uncharacterized membrane protein YeaQ/YmgE (transglycosylase-associated protein family)
MWVYLIWILLGAVAGWLAGQLFKGHGFGFIVNVIVGIVGALLGGWLFGLLGISIGGWIGSLITAVIGAVVLLWIISLFKKK